VTKLPFGRCKENRSHQICNRIPRSIGGRGYQDGDNLPDSLSLSGVVNSIYDNAAGIPEYSIREETP